MLSSIINKCFKYALNNNKTFTITEIYEENESGIGYNEVLNALKRIDKLFIVNDTQIELKIQVNNLNLIFSFLIHLFYRLRFVNGKIVKKIAIHFIFVKIF